MSPAWGHILILKFWNFRCLFAFKASCITRVKWDPAFLVEKLPPAPASVCMSSWVCLSPFLSVCLCLCPDSSWVSLAYFFSCIWGGGGPPVSLCFSLDLCVPTSTSHPQCHLSVSFLWDILSFSLHPNAQNSWLSWCLFR